MAKLFAGEFLWAELRRAARRSSRLDAAVAFVGRNPELVLRWPRKTTLVSDVSIASVESGRTSARGVRLLANGGARVRSVAGLHAKVYVFDRVAFVGSPNASEHSASLVEAAVRVVKPAEVEAARAFVRHLWRDASPLPDVLLKQLIRLEPRRAGAFAMKRHDKPRGLKRGTDRFSDLLQGHNLWLDAVTPEEVPKAVDNARKRTAAQLVRANEVDDVSGVEWTGQTRRIFKSVPEQDFLFVWWEPKPHTKRSPYGRLEGPLRCLGGFDHGKALGEHRFARAEHGVRKVNVALDAPGVASLSRLIPRAKVASSREHAVHLHDRIGRGAALRLADRYKKMALLNLIKRLSQR